jgi:SLT domain-containing protein
MQVIDPTFRAYAYPGYDSNIYDPLSNILAAIRYTLSRYGSLENGWQGHGYAGGIGKFNFGGWCADGGMFDKPTVIGVGESGPEASLPLNDNAFSRIAQGIVKNSDSDNNESVLERMDSIVERMGKLEQAILDRPVALYTDDQKIAESANRGNTRIARRYHTAT